MSSAMIKLGLLSIVSSVLAAPVAQPAADGYIATVPEGYAVEYKTVVKTAYYTQYGSPTQHSAHHHSRHSTHRGTHHSTRSTTAAPVSASSPASVSTPSTPATTLVSVSVPVSVSIPTTPATTPAPPAYTPPATTSKTSAAASPSGAVGGKRGIPYNKAELTTCFGDSKVSWAHNWANAPDGLDESKFEFVPMLWTNTTMFTDGWDDAVKAAKAKGTKNLMAFNEVDLAAQANLTPEAAAEAYRKWMQPYGSDFRLGSPSVTNGGGAMGLTWLGNFMTACSDCQIDFVNVHWYDSYSNLAYFKQHLTDAHTQTGKKVWLTEFGSNDGSDADISGFLQEATAWMDDQDFIERYAYFMAADGKLNTGTEMSTYGKTYASA